MHKGKYMFAQLLDFIDKGVVLGLANKYDRNRYFKQFTCYEMLQIVSISLTDTINLKTYLQNLTTILSMNWMVLPNQLCFNC